VKNHPLSRPTGALNPGEFDYRKYLERQGVAWTIYLPDQSFQKVSSFDMNAPSQWPTVLAQKADAVFRLCLKTDSSYGLVKAMLLGQRGDLGYDLLNNYITAGAVHVLSVSGLHVNLLFVFLAWMTGSLRKSRRGRYIYLVIAMGFLIFYALLTGMSPSVVRASLMCFVFAVSQVFKRDNEILNTLALSAFLILLLDPQALFAVGFQLSYAAMLGIILVYPLLKDSIQIQIKPFRWLWQITLVGCTAQLFTLPISIYYFHQFPTYFWLVNPFVILLTTVLMYSALALLAISFLSLEILTKSVGWGLDQIAQLMNAVVAFPKSLPGYVMGNLNLDLVEVILLSVWVLMVYRVLETREFVRLKRLFLITLLFVQYALWNIVSDFATPSLHFHSVPRHTVLSAIQGQTGYVIADKAFLSDTNSFKAHIQNHFTARGVRQIQYVPLADTRANTSLRIHWQGTSIGLDSQNETGDAHFTVLRNKFYPRADYTLPPHKTTYILSPELGFKTRERWIEVFEKGRYRYQKPGESGSIEF
jgi:competence protein ComEC